MRGTSSFGMKASEHLDAAILSVAQHGLADEAAFLAGVPVVRLMEAAGWAVAQEVLRLRPPRKGPIVVLCGPGNNGGDGFAAATVLRHRGWPVRVCLLGSVEKMSDAARFHFERWRSSWGGEVMPLSTECLEGAVMVIDALFGAGLSRPLEGTVAEVITRLNAQKIPCVAVDLPSGVSGDSGRVATIAPCCISSVTFFRPKPGHFLYPGRYFRGNLRVVPIGIPENSLHDIAPSCFVNGPSLWRIPRPDWSSHKYSRGYAVVLCGETMTGAGQLAAMAARRVGVGMVMVAASPGVARRVGIQIPGVLTAAVRERSVFAGILGDKRKNAYVLGPGAGVTRWLRDCVLDVLAAGRSCVLDADALSVFSDDPGSLWQAIAECRGDVVITPHDGEYARLFSFSGSRLDRARQAAACSGATVLLKGADTVVARPDGVASILENAPPDLATAGAGDVLAGMIGGLLAQGLSGFEAGCAASWCQAEAAHRIGPGLIAEDLVHAVPEILGSLSSG